MNAAVTTRPPWQALALILLAAVHPPTLANEGQAVFDPARAGWSEVHLKATKFFQSMRVSIAVSQPDADAVEAGLVSADEHRLLPVTAPVTRLGYATDALGRRNAIELLLATTTGQALQRTNDETGNRLKHRVYRFGPAGVLRRTHRPRPGEQAQPPAAWSDRSERWYPTPLAIQDQPLTETGALIYLIAASPLARPGDRIEMHAFSTSDERVYLIEAEVLPPERIEFEYRLADRGDRELKGKTDALRIAIRGRPLSGDGELTLFGMSDIELLLEPTTRAPLQLRGTIAMFSRITFKLKRLAGGG